MKCLKISEALEQKKTGLYFGNRIILPFRGHILKIILHDEILTDFSHSHKQVQIFEEEYFTNVYFLETEDIENVVTKYQFIKMIMVDREDDVFDLNNHKKILLSLEKPHTLKIEAASDEVLFIE